MRLRSGRLAVPAPSSSEGVTTLELFFDLVFVYTITQITTVVAQGTGAAGHLRAFAILVVIWWMYNGYCWLSNNVGPTTLSTRLPMLVAMCGFLIIATAIPEAFGDGAWPLAIAYVVVVLVHALQFGRSTLGGSARAILRILPMNLTIAGGLVLAALLEPHNAEWVGWSLALATIVWTAATGHDSGFALRPEHFAERHSLLIIIALGEIVVATGAGAQGHLDDLPVLTAVLLSMALLSSLWWAYFGGDDALTSDAFLAAPPESLSGQAFWAYSFGHVWHVAGLVLVAAGLHEVVANPDPHLTGRFAVTMAAGTALFLLAQLFFRRRLGIRGGRALVLGAVLCGPATVLGPAVGGLAELAALAAVVTLTLVIKQREMPAANEAAVRTS